MGGRRTFVSRDQCVPVADDLSNGVIGYNGILARVGRRSAAIGLPRCCRGVFLCRHGVHGELAVGADLITGSVVDFVLVEGAVVRGKTGDEAAQGRESGGDNGEV